MTSGLAHVETCISCVLKAPLGLSWQAARQWGTAPWLGRTGEPLRVAQVVSSSHLANVRETAHVPQLRYCRRVQRQPWTLQNLGL